VSTNTTISPTEYKQRREALMAKIGGGTAIFGSAPPAVAHNDVEYPYRQESDFFYLTGFNEPDAVAVLAPHHEEHKFILFVRPKEREAEIWNGYRVGVDNAVSQYGADIAYPIEELAQKLPLYLVGADRLYYRFGRDLDLNNLVISQSQKLMRSFAKRGTGPVAIEDPMFVLHLQRMVKSEGEIEMLRLAADIAAEAHERARSFAEPGVWEYQVQAEIQHAFQMRGAMGEAYPSIVAGGKNACILHYTENNCQLHGGDLLLIDAGCTVGYYNSDITRTFPIDGKFTGEQKALYEIVLAAQLASINCVRIGGNWDDFHKTSVRVVTEGLVDVGLLVGDVDKLIEEEQHKNFFMHGTGHWLGLDVHDAGTYKLTKDDWYQFQPGNVITVEPGIYIAPDIEPKEGQPAIDDRWKGIGIRIEDDVLVTTGEPDILTSKVPKYIADIER
jgi:Xaa-Pro aminopeptidase